MDKPNQAAGKAGITRTSTTELERRVTALESAIKRMLAERRAKKRVGGKFNPKNFI